MSIVLLILTVILSTLRDVFSKDISDMPFGTKGFFLRQAAIFLSGSVVLMIASLGAEKSISGLTILYALVYGLLLIAAQYGYTYAMKKGNLGICSTVYSMGFIFPALSGSIFWNEPLNVCNILGMLAVIPAIVISGKAPKESGRDIKNGYIFPLIAAMLSSGGLGIMQKVQQNSPHPEEINFFVIIAFAFAGLTSLIFALLSKSGEKAAFDRKLLVAGGIGVAFGLSNLLNTILAGSLASVIFFPVLNISRIFSSLVLGVIVFKERLSGKDYSVLLFGILAIILLTI